MSLLRALCSVAIAVSLFVAPAAPVAAQQDTNLETIRALYHNLLDLFYRPLEPRMLLQAGWGAVQADAAAHAVNVPAALGDLPDDPDQAFNVFATAYGQYVAGQSG